MSTLSSFRINQPPGSPTTPYDRAREDLVLTSNVELEAELTAESSYLWECVGAPPGVSVTMGPVTANKADFPLPVDGPYMFKLTVNAGNPATESETVIYVGTPMVGLSLPMGAFDETNQDNSRTPYDGARGHYDKTYEFWRLASQKLGGQFTDVGSSRDVTVADEGKWLRPTAGALILTINAIASFREGADFFVTTGTQAGISVVVDADASTIIGVFTQTSNGWGTTPSKLKLEPGASVWFKRQGAVWYAEVLGGQVSDGDTPADIWSVGSPNVGLVAHTHDSDEVNQISSHQTGTGALAGFDGYVVDNLGAVANIILTIPAGLTGGEKELWRFMVNNYDAPTRALRVLSAAAGNDKLRLRDGSLVDWLESDKQGAFLVLLSSGVATEGWFVVGGRGRWIDTAGKVHSLDSESLSGTGAPSGVTPEFIGQVYMDTTAKKTHVAWGLGSGEFSLAAGGMLVYEQTAEPTLPADLDSAIWVDTDDSNRVYLIFRKTGGGQVGVELT